MNSISKSVKKSNKYYKKKLITYETWFDTYETGDVLVLSGVFQKSHLSVQKNMDDHFHIRNLCQSGYSVIFDRRPG